MSLGFLSPAPKADTPARSPVLDAALAAGAKATVEAGWEVVESFGDPAAEAAACREAVGFADRSELGKFELQRPRGDAGDGFDGGAATRSGRGWRCPVRPDRELVLCEAADAEAVRSELEAEPARLCDLSGSLAALAIAGPRAREVFARFCASDLREGSMAVGGFRPGSVARTPGFVLREGADRFLLLAGAAFSEYLWETVALAAAGLGGRPVGVSALPPAEGAADA